jgi:hypothetical protein
MIYNSPKNGKSFYASPLAAIVRALWPPSTLSKDEIPGSIIVGQAITRNWQDKSQQVELDGGYIVFVGTTLAAPNPLHHELPMGAPKRAKKRKSAIGPLQLSVTLEEATFTDEKFALYAVYQAAIHDEQDASPESFRKFICDSPLMRQPPEEVMELCWFCKFQICDF